MILGEVTLSIRVTIFTNALLGNNLRGSNSFNKVIIFTNALLGNDLRGSNSFNKVNYIYKCTFGK